MKIACLDLEGVLLPEIWSAIADHTGNKQLRLTTRDTGDYQELMNLRLGEIKKEGLSFSDIMKVVSTVKAFPGARDFLRQLHNHFQVAILSDTFYQFANPLMDQLDSPMLLCHNLQVENDHIVGYTLRQDHPKRHAVKAFQSLNYQVVAAGDSLNDCEMLESADLGVLFRAADTLRERYPHLDAVDQYNDLLDIFVRFANK